MNMNVAMAVFRVLGVTLMMILIVEGATRETRAGPCARCRTSQSYINQNLNFCMACHSSPMSKKNTESATYTDVRQQASNTPSAEYLKQMIESTNDLLGNVLRLLQFEKQELERIENGSAVSDLADDERRRQESERQKLLMLRNMLSQ